MAGGTPNVRKPPYICPITGYNCPIPSDNLTVSYFQMAIESSLILPMKILLIFQFAKCKRLPEGCWQGRQFWGCDVSATGFHLPPATI